MREHILHRLVLQSVNVEVLNDRILRVFDRGMNHEDIGYPQIEEEAVHHSAIRNAIFVDKQLFGRNPLLIVIVIRFMAHYAECHHQ